MPMTEKQIDRIGERALIAELSDLVGYLYARERQREELERLDFAEDLDVLLTEEAE
jgi:hypothetical protein